MVLVSLHTFTAPRKSGPKTPKKDEKEPVGVAPQNKSEKIANNMKSNASSEAEQEGEEKLGKETKVDPKANKDLGKSSL